MFGIGIKYLLLVSNFQLLAQKACKHFSKILNPRLGKRMQLIKDVINKNRCLTTSFSILAFLLDN